MSIVVPLRALLCLEAVRWDELEGHQGSSEVLGKGGERDAAATSGGVAV